MPVNCPDERLARSIEPLPSNVNVTESEDEAVCAVVDGSEFEIDEAVFRVKMADKAAKTALCISVDEGSVEATFNFRHVAPPIVQRMQQNLKDSTAKLRASFDSARPMQGGVVVTVTSTPLS
jgi:predicted ribosome-associated RNA-binding protein Tma20